MRISSAPCKPSTVCCGIAFSSEAGTGSIVKKTRQPVRVKKTRQIKKRAAGVMTGRTGAPSKKAGARPAFFLKTLLKDVQLRLTSVLCDDRASPAVIHANRDQIDVLTNALGSEEHARRRRDEIDGPVLREDVIVLDAG